MTRLNAEILDLARSQHGMFTTRQALTCGHSEFTLHLAVTEGEALHPFRGAYAVQALVSEHKDQWHLHCCAAAHLVYPDAVLASASAVLAQDVPVWGADLSRPRLRRPIHRAPGVQGVWVREAMGTTVVDTCFGPATSLAEAIVQVAIDDGIAPGVVCADAALHMGKVSLEELQQEVDRRARRAGVAKAKSMLTFVDAGSESVGESRTRLQMVVGGLDVESQFTIERDGVVQARSDFKIRGTNVLVEFDGRLKYDDPEVLWREKKREDWLRSLGYVLVRITWRDLERGLVVAKVRGALKRELAVQRGSDLA